MDFSWLTSELVKSCGAPQLGWAWVIPLVIAAVSAIGSGMSGAKAAKRNQNAAESAAFYTAKDIYETGVANANAKAAAVRANNLISAAMTTMKVKDNWDLSLYNADLRMLIGDYNAQVKESEVGRIWESADLDITQIENQGSKLKGEILSAYGASGAQINDTDSVADALTNAESATEMQKLIIRHGADIRATEVMNQGARSRWDGYMSASQIVYEGAKANMGALGQTAIGIVGNTIQGQIDARMTYENAVRGAATTMSGGSAQGQMYSSQAAQAMANGLFTAAGSMASMYVASRNPTTDTTMATTADTSATTWNGMTSSPSGNMSATLLGGSSTYSSQLEPLYEN